MSESQWIAAILGLCAFIGLLFKSLLSLVKWILDKSEKQVQVNEEIKNTLSKISVSVEENSKNAAKAHEKSALVLDRIASSQDTTCGILTNMYRNGNGAAK